MIPPLTRPPIGHPGERSQQVTANDRRRVCGSGPPVRQLIREPGRQPSARRGAATGNDTIEHGEAPADEGP